MPSRLQLKTEFTVDRFVRVLAASDADGKLIVFPGGPIPPIHWFGSVGSDVEFQQEVSRTRPYGEVDWVAIDDIVS